MKDIVIYHADCTDGFGAAYAAWTVLGNNAEYLPARYGDFDSPVTLAETFDCTLAERTVYILDFSVCRRSMEWLLCNAGRVVWLDHHKTAFEMWCPDHPYEGEPYQQSEYREPANARGCDIVLDNNKSGALLAWEYFRRGTPPPRVIRHIDDRDRWQWKLPGSREIHAALQLEKPWSFTQWDDLTAGCHYDALRSAGDVACRVADDQTSAAAGRALPCTIAGERGLAVNCAENISEVGHQVAEKSGTYGLIWYHLAAPDKVACSLRSVGDYDVSALAKRFGGGGHKNAAGFSTDMATVTAMLAG